MRPSWRTESLPHQTNNQGKRVTVLNKCLVGDELLWAPHTRCGIVFPIYDNKANAAGASCMAVVFVEKLS